MVTSRANKEPYKVAETGPTNRHALLVADAMNKYIAILLLVFSGSALH